MAHHLISRDALGALTKLGQGGQGIVYQASNVKAKFANRMVFKEYKPQARSEVDFEALSAMPALVEETLPHHDGERLISIAAWPCAVVKSDTGPVGFVMPSIPDAFFIDLTTVKGSAPTIAEFQHLLNPAEVLTARGVAITDQQRYQLVQEVAKALSFLHRIGVCVGDISPKNVLFSLEPRPAVYFVDCDTMRVDGVSALPQRETPEWQVPPGEELATVCSDTYKLGLLALRLVTGDQRNRSPNDLPLTTPKPLRQLITDTLTKSPDHRPLPEAWTYLLGNVIDDVEQATTDSVADPAPAPPVYPPEPPPVVRSRPSDSTSAPTPAPSVTGFHLTSEQKFFAAAAIGVPFFIAILAGAVAISANQGSPSSSTTQRPSTTSRTPAASSMPSTSTTSSTGDVERIIRSAEVGECFSRTMGPEDSAGRADIIDLSRWGCGNSGSEIRIVGKQLFYTESPPLCDTYSDGRMWTGGSTPRVLLCFVSDN